MDIHHWCVVVCSQYGELGSQSEMVGIIPGAGDVADATLNYMLVVRKAKQAEYVVCLYGMHTSY